MVWLNNEEALTTFGECMTLFVRALPYIIPFIVASAVLRLYQDEYAPDYEWVYTEPHTVIYLSEFEGWVL